LLKLRVSKQVKQVIQAKLIVNKSGSVRFKGLLII
jgi:hypothetical protein